MISGRPPSRPNSRRETINDGRHELLPSRIFKTSNPKSEARINAVTFHSICFRVLDFGLRVSFVAYSCLGTQLIFWMLSVWLADLSPNGVSFGALGIDS